MRGRRGLVEGGRPPPLPPAASSAPASSAGRPGTADPATSCNKSLRRATQHGIRGRAGSAAAGDARSTFMGADCPLLSPSRRCGASACPSIQRCVETTRGSSLPQAISSTKLSSGLSGYYVVHLATNDLHPSQYGVSERQIVHDASAVISSFYCSSLKTFDNGCPRQIKALAFSFRC
ncbi:uncharacterized protein LOC126349094 [Schistocerca gregaria]|uniref:uncharacterized protein LOC126349094 n=1 Tax=Schistocerca gregaria TaxID=7010 RepID=UPI00211DA52B|nr:uncharacterized protein LOC126349094 [Schistocerca gregaria]